MDRVYRTGRVFYIRLPDGSKAFLRYHVEDGSLYLDATYTPERWRGRGLAARLVEEAVKYAVENGLKVVPVCSYSIYFFMKRPELRYLLDDRYRDMDLEDLYRVRLREEAEAHK